MSGTKRPRNFSLTEALHGLTTSAPHYLPIGNAVLGNIWAMGLFIFDVLADVLVVDLDSYCNDVG
jgi:hypothetical protein